MTNIVTNPLALREQDRKIVSLPRGEENEKLGEGTLPVGVGLRPTPPSSVPSPNFSFSSPDRHVFDCSLFTVTQVIANRLALQELGRDLVTWTNVVTNRLALRELDCNLVTWTNVVMNCLALRLATFGIYPILTWLILT